MDIETKKRYIRNINKLSKPSLNYESNRAICGDFGIIKIDHSAHHDIYGKRIFIVSKSKKLGNGGNWTFNSLRKAILATD